MTFLIILFDIPTVSIVIIHIVTSQSANEYQILDQIK